MAFNFLGTLSIEQLNELEAFLTTEIVDIDEQINALRTEVDNLKLTRAEMITADGNNGGTTNKWINDTLLQEIQRIARPNDANSASIIQKIKKPFLGNIKYKRERLEFKIKKLTDAIDQGNEMIDRKAIAKDQTTQLIASVRALFTEENANHLFQTTRELKQYYTAIPKEQTI